MLVSIGLMKIMATAVDSASSLTLVSPPSATVASAGSSTVNVAQTKVMPSCRIGVAKVPSAAIGRISLPSE